MTVYQSILPSDRCLVQWRHLPICFAVRKVTLVAGSATDRLLILHCAALMLHRMLCSADVTLQCLVQDLVSKYRVLSEDEEPKHTAIDFSRPPPPGRGLDLYLQQEKEKAAKAKKAAEKRAFRRELKPKMMACALIFDLLTHLNAAALPATGDWKGQYNSLAWCATFSYLNADFVAGLAFPFNAFAFGSHRD